MNNNGVINGVTNTGQNDQPTLAPMAGVRIAPANEVPMDASQSQQVAVAPANYAVQSQQVSAVPVNQMVQPQQPVGSSVVQNSMGSLQQPQLHTAQYAVSNQNRQMTPPPQPPVVTPPVHNSLNNNPLPPPKKKRGGFAFLLFLLFLLLLGLGFYTYYSSKNYEAIIRKVKHECSPITGNKEKELDLNSTLVKDLYSKVSTNMREDLAQPQFNDEMKLYLAYRQVLDKDKYDSNCNLFSLTSMEPYSCEESTNFVPKAFKEEALIQQVKKLYGDNTNIPLQNIQLGTSCIGGYQYIQERGEFVEGVCNQQIANSYKVTKTLTKAVSVGSTIVLTEDVKYHENEKLALPEYLKSGIYKYTFRLDMNYNYVFVDKAYEEKY